MKQKEDGSGPYLESLDKEFHTPVFIVFYPRNSLAMNATVCRVEQVDDEGPMSPHACVRAIVELKSKFRPDNFRNKIFGKLQMDIPIPDASAATMSTPDQLGQATSDFKLRLCKRGQLPVRTTDGTSWRSAPSI